MKGRFRSHSGPSGTTTTSSSPSVSSCGARYGCLRTTPISKLEMNSCVAPFCSLPHAACVQNKKWTNGGWSVVVG